MLEPQGAIVRPRVFVPEASQAVLLEDEVERWLDRGRTGLVALVGNPGSGKSTAIAHLARLFGDDPAIKLIDRPSGKEIGQAVAASADQLIVCASHVLPGRPQVWRLAPWTRDDWIDYLLAAHREECRAVMARLQDDRAAELLTLPELTCAVLDRLAADAELTDARAALHQELHARLDQETVYLTARRLCFEQTRRADQNKLASRLDETVGLGTPGWRLLRHEPARRLLAVEHLVEALSNGKSWELLNYLYAENIIRDIGRQLSPDLLKQLEQILRGRKTKSHPMAASLLHAAGVAFVPKSGRAPVLAGAYLSGVQWSGIQLERLRINDADLSGADLSESRLKSIEASKANLSGCNLHGASLTNLVGESVNLSGADLSFVRANGPRLYGADLSGANLEGALLQAAHLIASNLTAARLVRANLAAANLQNVQLADADFTGADLTAARLGGLPLNRANFSGATFKRAWLSRCDMEGMRLAGCSFENADLTEAYLTGSQIANGQFRYAILCGAALAEIEWERADLRDADLSRCTFHLGSSRSGLVGSPIASEGSRTGFYTDELHEQDFKPPEEIRKANLRGADLRGANLDHTDFYLVDLRDARYTSDQEAHLRRTGAILASRV